jgi:predicted transcriptional regulator
METKPDAKRDGSITERSAYWTSKEGKAEADAIEVERQRKLPKPKPGGLVGWVLERVRKEPVEENDT